MRLDNLKVQGGQGAQPALSSACVCGTVPVVASEATCPQCGGSLGQTVETAHPARVEHRRLQDFLSAFV